MTNVIQLPYRDAREVDAICADVRSGRGAFVTFGTSQGAFLEVAGPKGLPGWKLLCNAPIPQVLLHQLEPGVPLATAAANREFPRGLDDLATKAAPLLGDETPFLQALLAAIQETTATMRFRVPSVSEIVEEEGEPLFGAWASCLSLGVLQRCIERARRVRSAA